MSSATSVVQVVSPHIPDVLGHPAAFDRQGKNPEFVSPHTSPDVPGPLRGNPRRHRFPAHPQRPKLRTSRGARRRRETGPVSRGPRARSAGPRPTDRAGGGVAGANGSAPTGTNSRETDRARDSRAAFAGPSGCSPAHRRCAVSLRRSGGDRQVLRGFPNPIGEKVVIRIRASAAGMPDYNQFSYFTGLSLPLNPISCQSTLDPRRPGLRRR